MFLIGIQQLQTILDPRKHQAFRSVPATALGSFFPDGSWSPWRKQTVRTTCLQTIIANTPPKINIEPENDGLEDHFPFQLGEFEVPC